ncbi:hypothetical protein [Vagococcus intermedius]|uniref:DUF4352 domain-containing protein n=1 Tax=Vagococcus intermedius TaxID=2991418 RepID=A0AAF0CT67_9ENTE|nr:hypothetical protein [Vagococcus intermedius]WEG72441.1 hypothetical protein OL234_05500 [Vagococcus intermedius]WEG74528.1 hypothetical protein OL235_05505 [Vagococcus intermedius]
MKKIKLLSATLLAVLVLTACSPSLKPKEEKKQDLTEDTSKNKTKKKEPSEETPLKDKTNKKKKTTSQKDDKEHSNTENTHNKKKNNAKLDKNKTVTNESEQQSAKNDDKGQTDNKKTAMKKKKEQLPEPEGVQDEKIYTTDWNTNWNGLETSIGEVSVVKMDPEVMADSGIEGQGLVGVKFSLNNKSDIPLDVYPDQSQLNINGQIVEANMLASDQIGGQVQSGETKEGFVIYNLPELENIEELTNFNVEWRASHDEELVEDQETAFDTVYETGNDSSYQEFTANIQLK